MILWLAIIVIYAAVALGLNQARVNRFTAEQQRLIFEDMQDLWCTNFEIADRDERGSLDVLVNQMRRTYKLTELDMRIIFQREIAREEAVQPCLYKAVTWTQCVARTDEQLALNIGGTFGLSLSETDSILTLGEKQGWPAHTCLSFGQPDQ